MGNQPYNENYGQNHQPPPPPQDYGPQQYQQPPPPPPPQPQFYAPPHKPKKSHVVPIVIIVVVVVVIAAIAGAWFLMGGKQNSPESTFGAYVDAWNDEDVETAVHLTDVHFQTSSEIRDAINDLEDEMDYQDYYNIEIVGSSVIYKENLPSDERSEINDQIAELEDEYRIHIDTYARINYELRMLVDGDIENEDGDMYAIQVDGKWYLSMSLWYYDSDW